jgi:hypothetical protein
MRMSSGPSKRKLKPRSGVSIWGEETPRSSSDPALGERRRQLREAAMHDLEARVRDGIRALPRGRDRGRILVDRDDARPRAEPREQLARVPAAAEGAVDVQAVGSRHERIDRFVEQDGGVQPRVVHGAQNFRLSSACAAAAAADSITPASWAA